MKPYKGYRAVVRFDDESLVFWGEVIGIKDVITFQGQSASELVTAFQESVDDYLTWAKEDGFDPDRPFSGALSLRATPELHRLMSEAASTQAKSLNQWIVDALTERAAADVDRSATVS